MLIRSQKSGASTPATLQDRLNATRARIQDAAAHYGRTPESICLLAVSKTHPASTLRELAALGQRDFGESYLQEALPKLDVLADLRLTWHFIGQVQSNKTATIAERFDWVHTVDRERIARRLNDQRPAHAPALNVCIQVQLVNEGGKGGIPPDEVPALARSLRDLPKLRLRGLMCIPPAYDRFEEQYATFMRLRGLAEQLQAEGMPLDTLSMGMSGDLGAAIAAGATIVRIGTALFGERPPKT
ncbi:MAG: YggS family pyridoxal phosphate-dependent enzyme [Steroidobacteraceae bacterium]